MNRFTNIKSNKLNIITIFFALVSIIFFIIGLFYFLHYTDTPYEKILSMSANYITIISWVLVLIQLIAFVKDSRQKEFRCRKESALILAKEYANDLLQNFTYINSVLSAHYDSNNVHKLQEELEKLEITNFTKSTLGKNSTFDKLEQVFFNGQYIIDDKIIIERAAVHEIKGFSNLLEIENDIVKKNLANLRFKRLVCDTMNNLEYFAMSVNQNVAESDMLFVSLHQTYLLFIKYVYPYICNCNKDDEYLYTNVIDLYRKWSKIKKDNDILNRKKLEKHKKQLKKHNTARPL